MRETSAKLGNYATLDLANVFEQDQTFKKNANCNKTPTQSYHLVNKEYADSLVSNIKLPDNLATTDKEQNWSKHQTFGAGCTIPEPELDNNPATKSYVDMKTSTTVTDATYDTKGIVKMTLPVSNEETPPDNMQSIAQFAQNTESVPTPKDVADYVAVKLFSTSIAFKFINRNNLR